jgi:hypothetical protein
VPEVKGFDVKDGDLSSDFRLVAYRSQFRPQWLTKINLFTVVTETEVATPSTVEEYTKRHSITELLKRVDSVDCKTEST